VIQAVDDAIQEIRQLQRSESRPRADRAEIEFGEVEVGEGRRIPEPNVFHEDWQGVPIVFHLVNPQGSLRARAIWPTISVKTADERVLAGPANARWSNPQSSTSRKIERDIPANGAPVAIDTVIQEVGGDKFWLVTDAGLERGLKANTQAITARDFYVTVSIQGENVLQKSKTVRVRQGFPVPAIGDGASLDTILSPPQTSASEGSKAKLAIRRVYSELNGGRKQVNDAIDCGQFWNVQVEGLQSGEWDSARNLIAEEVPALWAPVDGAYVLIRDMNAAANDHAHHGVRKFDAKVLEDLKRLRSKMRQAMEALEGYFGDDLP
jgi:hypothetical protein